MSGRIEQNPVADPRAHDRIDPKRVKAEDERAASDRLEEIHQYLRDLYARREIIARTETPSGQEFDWVPIESQGPPGKAADPPSEDRPGIQDSGDEYRAAPARFELQAEGAESGPPGTVPLLRLPIDQITPTGNLQDWLAKGPRSTPVTPPDDPAAASGQPDHKYAHAVQYVPCYGTEGTLNCWRTYVEWSNEFSLAQLWLSRGSPIGHLRQTVEVGQQVYKDLYADWLPHLFVFFTTNDYTQQGDNLGGYNQLVAGWKQVASTIAPGVGFTTTSQYGGQQFDTSVKVQLSAGNWWVQVNGVWMGYYPASLFNATGLSDHSDMADWGGEIIDSIDNPGTTFTQMGSGRWPHEGWQWTAYARNLMYQSDPAGSMTRFNGFTVATHPGCYGINADFTSSHSWQSYFWYGGPGNNPSCP